MTDRLELPLRYRRELEALLREHVPDTEVWAYGSRVTGESHPASDLDLVLRGPSLEPLSHGFTDLLEALEDSNIPILVQAHDWARLPQSFHREFERDYVVIAERDDRATTRDWLRTTLGEVITLQRGFDLPKSKRIDGPFPVIASTGPVGTHEEAKVKGPGVVIGRSGSLGGGQYIESSFWPLNTTLWVKDFKGNDHRFCYYLLRSLDLAQFNVGSGVPTLNRNHVHPLPVFLPPLPEQRAIAHVLGTLDDKIELNRRMNQTLEEMARALFKSWFVDFGPVHAKMEGRDTGLPPDIADLFPDRLVPSELGEIPEGWEVKAFSYLLDDVIGGDWGKDDSVARYTEIVSIIRGTDLPSLSSGGVGSVPQRYTAPKKAERRLLQDGDIVIEVSGGSPKQPTGRSILVTSDIVKRFPGDVICASFCRRLRPHGLRESILASQHLAFLYSAGKMWDYQNQSTGIANFQTKRFLEEENIVWPGGEIASAFAQYLEPIIRRTTHNESLNLMALRDALLPKLISGQIRVANIADALGGSN